MNLIDRDGIRWFVSDLMRDPKITHGFSTRIGGVSVGPYRSLNLWYDPGDARENVAANRKRFAEALGIDPPRLSTARQVHGDEVLEVRGAFFDRAFTADGLVTNRPGVYLAAGTADCVPILLWDPEHRAVGAVHTGWKGTELGIARRAVEKLGRLFGSDPSGVLAAIGPAAGPCCYEVTEDVARLFSPEFLQRLPDGRTHLDLWAANRRQLLEAGLRPENIDEAALCTICNPDLLFSYRRDRGVTGGMLAVIGLCS